MQTNINFILQRLAFVQKAAEALKSPQGSGTVRRKRVKAEREVTATC